MTRLPDFIIAGAMKCGTTSLHHILAQHPQVFIPAPEIHYFSMDDFTQYPDFFVYAQDEWWFPNLDADPETYLAWYLDFFKPARSDQFIGEDSTVYLTSRKAAPRIAQTLPAAKIMIMLRNPTERAYSHYWHLVRTGRASWSFEQTLQVDQLNIVERSLYKPQVDYFLQFIPKEQVLFIVFEEFLKSMQAGVDQVCDFIGLSETIDLKTVKTHYNPSFIPKNIPLQLWRNRLMRLEARSAYLKRLPKMPPQAIVSSPFLLSLCDRLHHQMNPLQQIKPPPMNPKTKAFLNGYFQQQNQGLSEVIGKDTEAWWYPSSTPVTVQ